MTDEIQTDLVDRILTIRLNRPTKKNALTAAMYSAMANHLKIAGDNPAVRVVLITGGDNIFCSGNDLSDFLQNPPSGTDSAVFQFMTALAHFPKPVVAAVTGAAIGIGTTLLMHCDLVVAAIEARFQLPFVNLGICAEFASTYLLPTMAGPARAAELILLGDAFTAQTAREIGLINTICERAEVMHKAMGYAHTLAAKPPKALRINKSLLKRRMRPLIDQSMAAEGEQLLQMLHGPEAREAVAAVLEKRPADFSSL